MVLRDQVIHAHKLHLLTFSFSIRSHHKCDPHPNFDTSIITEKVPQSQINTELKTLLHRKIHGVRRGLCLQSEAESVQ